MKRYRPPLTEKSSCSPSPRSPGRRLIGSLIFSLLVLLPLNAILKADRENSLAKLLRPGVFFQSTDGSTAGGSPLGVWFVDIAKQVGLNFFCYYGAEVSKKYILEATGCGVAFIDYNNDGWQDIFFVNGSRLEGFPPGEEPHNRFYHNNGDGTFTDVTERAGLRRGGWGQGVCVGDYDNDGWEDLFVTYWGQNALYRNIGDNTFTEVTEKAGLLDHRSRPRWGTGCAFIDYDKDGRQDLFIAEYVDLDLENTPMAGEGPFCQSRGIPTICGPRGLPGGTNSLYHNNGDGSFTDVSQASGVVHPRRYYGFSVLTSDFDNDDWPDIYVACDSTPSILYHNNGEDGTFTDMAVPYGAAYNEDGMEQAGMGVSAGDYNRDGWI